MTTLSEVIENQYRTQHPDAAPGTFKKLRFHCKRWETFAGNCPVSQISRDKLTTFRDALLQAGYSSTTVNSNLSTVLALARICGRKIPTGDLMVIERDSDQGTLTLDQLGAIWRRTDSTTWPATARYKGRKIKGVQDPSSYPLKDGVWWCALLMLGFATGLPRAELFAIRWEDVKGDEIIKTSTTGVISRLPIPEPARPWLDLLRCANTETVLGWPDQHQQIDEQVRRLATLAGADVAGLSVIRRTSLRAYDLAVPGTGLIAGRFVTHETPSQFENPFNALHTAAKMLTFPPAFLEPPPTGSACSRLQSKPARKTKPTPARLPMQGINCPGSSAYDWV